MSKPSPALLFILQIPLFSLLFGCAAAPVVPEGIPLSEEEIAFMKELDESKGNSVIEEVPALFFHLRQLNKSWCDSSLFKDSLKHHRIYTNLGAIITRRVYLNFDKVLNELENGEQPNQVIAALSLGFSRIPENEKFPQVYPRAIGALLRALDSGDDAVIENALLGLFLLAEPDTQLDKILLLMTQHHNPEVRANAALSLTVLATEDKGDQVLTYLLPALSDDDPKVRLHAISVIANLKSPSAQSTLLDMLDDRYELIQANAARALGALGTFAACPKLIDNLDHVKEIIRQTSLTALKKISGENYEYDVEDWRDWYLEAKQARRE